MHVWKPAFKGLTVYSALFPFFSLFSGIWQNWVKLLYFLPNQLAYVLLSYFAIVVIINKAFKLFKLVLVVYYISCWQW